MKKYLMKKNKKMFISAFKTKNEEVVIFQTKTNNEKMNNSIKKNETNSTK